MTTPHVAVVHNNIDGNSAIGKLARWAVQVGLEAGWRVTAVAHDLDRDLRADVEWRHLFVPPRVHAVQWAVAEPTVRHALRGSTHDVLHVYQPQLTGFADTWHVSYLSRSAIEHGALGDEPGCRARLARAQAHLVARMEDAYLRRTGSGANVLWCSEFIRDEYLRLYGAPARGEILYDPALDAGAVAPQPRPVPAGGPVIGFLGGLDPRKGLRDLIPAVAAVTDATLVVAGPGSEGFSDVRLGERLSALGWTPDLTDFWASIDVLAMPSRFEPFGMAATEAAMRGIPVLLSPQVGCADLLLNDGAAAVWDGTAQDFADQLRALSRRSIQRPGFPQRVAETLDPRRLGDQLLAHWTKAVRA
ncbi:glycosyltransferase family 4 protein [Branchiibius sp. NY16-3462-2]|uniref:glycosyltransferase family 4 protein n=1 Tax=Branchiibius sp. NY16-3462-2 TaxID=1807500 RepID=UPI00079C92B4|nr:glycosyltransferase family 4 protein [Branchiibius sp. NY16-3462-2]KYH43063.1 hypothetical protein AZH51_06335 [Branchiibius sp. NY16-3462-2]